MDKRGLWQAVLGELEVTISRATFATWFKQTAIISNEDGHVVVAVPNIFNKERLEKKYHQDIKSALVKIAGGVRSIEYRISSPAAPAAEKPLEDTVQPATTPTPPSAPASPAALVPAAAPAANSNLNPRYRFSNYVVGGSNELAYAACQAVAKRPGTKYNPLFIYGGAGLGKTHLIQAVGNEILQHHPSKKVEYITSEAFTNEFLSCLQRKNVDAFKQKYRQVDVLIIDDMQFLATKERTKEEFFHTFNALHQASKQIIISSDKPPQAIAGLEDRLKSRFASGMIADIQPPDLEMRSLILQNKAAAQNFNLPPEVTDHLARHVKQNVRELEGALTQLIANCEFHNTDPSLATVTAVLSNIAFSKPKLKPLSPRTVIEKTAAYFDLRPDDITGPKRDKEIVHPRQIAIYLMRREMNLSFPKIAQAVGGRDHTTAMHSVTKIEKRLEADEDLRHEINAIKEQLFR
ncbi:chromosomal replication initiator protein DnaA [Candidatus Parcubacteria bacterium]|nr:chromosomal replication initiator protein DnaA [Candidatus Parcubacteria bacterium]